MTDEQKAREFLALLDKAYDELASERTLPEGPGAKKLILFLTEHMLLMTSLPPIEPLRMVIVHAAEFVGKQLWPVYGKPQMEELQAITKALSTKVRNLAREAQRSRMLAGEE